MKLGRGYDDILEMTHNPYSSLVVFYGFSKVHNSDNCGCPFPPIVYFLCEHA